MVKHKPVKAAFDAIAAVDGWSRNGKLNQSKTAVDLKASRTAVDKWSKGEVAPVGHDDSGVPFADHIANLLKKLSLLAEAGAFTAYITPLVEEERLRKIKNGIELGEETKAVHYLHDNPAQLQLRRLVRCTERGLPPTIAELFKRVDGHVTLAAQWWRMGSLDNSGDLPPYEPRDLDGALDSRLIAAMKRGSEPSALMLLVVGPSKAGKTRLLIEALNRRPELQNRRLHQLVNLNALSSYAAYANTHKVDPSGVVLFVDDLQKVLHPDHAERVVATFQSLTRARFLIVGTSHAPAFNKDSSPDLFGLSATDRDWLVDRTVGRVESGLTASEANESGRDEGFRLGEHHAGRATLRISSAAGSDPDSNNPEHHACAAVLAALTDVVLFEPNGAPETQVREWADMYWATIQPNRPLSDHLWHVATDWAFTQIGAVGSTWSIANHNRDSWTLTDPVTPHRIRHHTPHPAHNPTAAEAFNAGLRYHQMHEATPLSREFGTNETLPTAQHSSRRFTDAFLRSANRWFEVAASKGDGRAAIALGLMAQQQGDLMTARTDLQRALSDERSEVVHRALHNLAALERLDGNPDVARLLFQRLAADSNAEGSAELAALERDAGNVLEAERWWRLAADSGHVPSMLALGALLYDQGRPAEGKPLVLAAAVEGHAAAFRMLGSLEQANGDIDAAQNWWRRGASAGDGGCLVSLGRLARARGDIAAAKHWWSIASEMGETGALNGLGFVARFTGDLDGARRYWTEAARMFNSTSTMNLAFLEEAHCNHEAAQQYLDWATALGNEAAQRASATFKSQCDENCDPLPQEPAELHERWRTEAENGIGASAGKLASLLGAAGRSEEERMWLHVAATLGHIASMNNLGLRYKDLGEVRLARDWFQKSINAGSGAARANLAHLERRLGNSDAARRLFRHGAERGHIGLMYPLAMLERDLGNIDQSKYWLTRAAEAGHERARSALRSIAPPPNESAGAVAPSRGANPGA